jgi:hypothetical protein
LAELNDYVYRAKPNEIGRKIWSVIGDNASLASAASKIRDLYARALLYYFGRDYNGLSTTNHVSRGGDQGELAVVRLNHCRSLVQTLLNLVLSNKVVWQPVATNSDFKSAAQTILAANYCEYYWRDRQVSGYIQRCAEEAIVLGESFFFMPWDETRGENTPMPMLGPDGTVTGVQKTGDFDFRNISTWDVIRDPYKRTYDELDSFIVHTRENRYNLAARQRDPELQQKILQASDDVHFREVGWSVSAARDTCDTSVYYAYHKRTPAVPQGREVCLIGPETVLYDRPLTYDEIPLYRVSFNETFGTPFAYTPFFEILGLQELVDSLETAIATNQTTFGTQMVAVPAGSGISPESFGGVKLLTYPFGSQPPSGLQLTKTPAEIFQHQKDLIHYMELLMGLNGVARGEPQSGEQSGAALALLEAKAKQQSSIFEGNLYRLIQSVGTGLVQTFRRKCPFPRRLAISGVGNTSLERQVEVTRDSFSAINRVQIDIGNPLQQTPAGRQSLAQMYVQILGPDKVSPQQLEQVIATGRLEPMTQSLQKELLLIKSENESLARGEPVQAMVDDDHVLHLREHRGEMANPEVRGNPVALQAYTEHQNAHWQLYTQTDPARLVVFGQQPPPMMGPPPGPPGAPPPPGPSGPPGPEPKPEPPPGMGKDKQPADLPSQPKNPVDGQKFIPPPGALVQK